MAYMFNDDKSKNDVTEKPLIMTVAQTINISTMTSEEERTISTNITVPTGYTVVGIADAIVLDSDNELYYGNMEVMQDSILKINNKICIIFRLKCLGNPAGSASTYLLKYNILFVRSEFASIELLTNELLTNS